MECQAMFELKPDDAKFGRYLDSRIDARLRVHGLLPVTEAPAEATTAEPENFFAASQNRTDLLRQLQGQIRMRARVAASRTGA
jgi:hypothetical protein